MENVLIFIALILSKLTAPAPPPELPTAPDAMEVVWSSLYPSLAASTRVRQGEEKSLLVEDPVTNLGPTALYAANRTVWRNFLGQAAAAAEDAAGEEAELSSLAEMEKVRARLAERLERSAGIVLKQAASDWLSPASRELATACMDLSDLDIPLAFPDPTKIESPLLGAYLALFSNEADQPAWQEFAAAAQEARYPDAVHLVPRVPQQFLGQAYILLDHIGPPEDFEEAEQRVLAREFIELRMRLTGSN